MPELTLLVNSTDAALLNGSAAAPVAAGGAAGGFASVLGKRLIQGESIVTKEAPSQTDEVSGRPVTENGESPPVNGTSLPLAEPQNTTHKPETSATGNPVLNASLLSAIAQGTPAPDGQAINTSLASTVNPVPGSAPQFTVSQRAITRPVTENSRLSVALNTTLHTQAVTPGQHNMSPALPGGAVDVQQASTLSLAPTMPGKPVSAMAQQALMRASLNADKAYYLRADMTSATGPASVNTSLNSDLSGALNGINNPTASTMRMDMFAAAMGTTTQTGANTERHLPITSANPTVPVSLIATGTLPDDTSNVLTGMPRLPGTIANGPLPTLMIPTPVGQSAWASELGQRVTWLANSELREAQLQLNPRSLGAVDVRIVYGPEQQLSVSFNVANPVAREALDASLPRLREMFEQQGLHLADANISNESPAKREQRNSMNNESLTPVDNPSEDEALMNAASLHPLSSHWLGEGMLDAYA